MTTLRDQLKAGLSGRTPEPGSDSTPSVPELADHIKALQAAHNIDPTPQRVRQKQTSAEEPVTARIRRRAESMPASDTAADAAVSLEPLQDSSGNPPPTFQERLAIERQRQLEGPSIPN
ncbi:MAG: hypothetical protein ABSB42_07385 [Tepidisphaeraceae bacterium]